MKYLKLFLFYWLPTIIWAGTIFFFSSRQHFGITHESNLDFYIFKLLHMAEFGGLYFWLLRSLYETNGGKKSNAVRYAFIIAACYAFSDEIHESFTPTREPRLRDIVIDTIGITITYFIINTQWRWIKKILQFPFLKNKKSNS